VSSGTADTAGCINDGFTFNREIVYWLEFAATTVNLVVQDSYSGQSSNVNHAVLILDDEALSAVGGVIRCAGSLPCACTPVQAGSTKRCHLEYKAAHTIQFGSAESTR